MLTHFGIRFTKTFATPIKAQQAVEKVITPNFHEKSTLRYTIVPVETDKGLRYGVLFVGLEAVKAGVHHYFNVIR